MAKPKKSRAGKKHTPIVPSIPVLFDTIHKIEYVGVKNPMLAAQIILGIETLIARPSTPACDNVTVQLAQISIGLDFTYGLMRSTAPEGNTAAIMAALQVMQTVAARTTHAEPVHITEEEGNLLLACIPLIAEALCLIPEFIWERAALQVKKNAKIARQWIFEQVREAA